ncbi:MAG: PAS domain-containing protein, partial [Burkholderiales bacterium]
MNSALAGAKSKYLLYASFGLLLAALTALIALGLARIESFNQQIHALTEAQNRKIGAVSELFLSNGQRSTLIDKLFGAETTQARKTVHDQYLRAIETYARAVERLRALQVDRSELAAHDGAIAAAARARAIGEDIVGLLMKGEIARASELNLTQAVLDDSRSQETLYLLLEANHARTSEAIATANQGMRNGFLLIGAGGILALLAGIVIAVLVIRIVSATEAKLEHEKELAQVTLHSIVDGVITTDAAGRVEYLNPVAEQYLGWTGAQAFGKPLSE